MKSYRRIATLFLCLLMVCTAACASAATKKPSKTFTTAPVLKFVKTPRSADSGDIDDLTINASMPGFFTLRLTDESGNVVQTIFDHLEISSKNTSFDFYATYDNGDPLPAGTYLFSAEMVSQFGVASKEITKSVKVKENEEMPVTATTTTTSTTASSDTTAATGAASNTSTSSTQTVSATAVPKATPVPEKIEYAAGESKMGDEGLLIGVGVSDVATQDDAGYWGLTANASDAELWAAITRKMIGVDVGENESAYIYDSPLSGRNKIGTVSGISQGLNVITKRGDGWSLVEAYRNEDGAFVRGYIKSDKLRPVDPNPNYGIVIDKTAQTLTILKDGVRVGSCKVATGLATPKYPHRETPAGEFITVTRRGSTEYYGMGYTKYTIRINGSYCLAEIPTTKKNGTKFLDDIQNALGAKATRGTVCIASDASTDGGINAKWIWDMTDTNKRVKVLIFDDKPRTDVPVYSK